MEKTIICTVCPQGCRIAVAGEGSRIESVTGVSCPRGKAYAEQEFICPMRILTGSVRTSGAAEVLLPVRSADRIPRDRVMNTVLPDGSPNPYYTKNRSAETNTYWLQNL